MKCTSFDSWLDEGMPAALAQQALAHVTTCSRCAVAHGAALELEALLALEPVPAPATLRGEVLTRIAGGRHVAVTSGALQPSPLPWWVQAAAEPRFAVGLAAVAVLYREAGSIASLLAGLGPAVRTWLGSVAVQFPPVVNPVSWFGLACAAVPVGLLVSVALYRGADSWVQRTVLGSRALGRE